MIVFFEKSKLYQHHYIMMSRNDRLYSHSYSLTATNKKDIKKVLKENFKSVLFANSHTFTFGDVADETFFLVWSSDGIEI